MAFRGFLNAVNIVMNTLPFSLPSGGGTSGGGGTGRNMLGYEPLIWTDHTEHHEIHEGAIDTHE
jgi:hypothetical protein